MTDGSNEKKTGLRKGLATYGDAEFSLFMRRVFIKAMGYTDDALDRPIIGITDTYSDFNPCHGNVPDLIEAAKRGIMLAGPEVGAMAEPESGPGRLIEPAALLEAVQPGLMVFNPLRPRDNSFLDLLHLSSIGDSLIVSI